MLKQEEERGRRREEVNRIESPEKRDKVTLNNREEFTKVKRKKGTCVCDSKGRRTDTEKK